MKAIVTFWILVGCIVSNGQAEVQSMLNSILFQDGVLQPGHVLDHWRSILSRTRSQIGSGHWDDIKQLVNISHNTEKALITGSINDIIKTQEKFLLVFKRLYPYIPKTGKNALLSNRIADCEKLIEKLKYHGGNLYDVAAFFKQSKADFMTVLNNDHSFIPSWL